MTEYNIDYLKTVFVCKDDCTVNQNKMHDEMSSIKLDMVSVKTKLNILIAILSAIGAAVLGVAVKLLFA